MFQRHLLLNRVNNGSVSRLVIVTHFSWSELTGSQSLSSLKKPEEIICVIQ